MKKCRYCGALSGKNDICFNCRDKLFLLRLMRDMGRKLMERREKERHAAYIGWCKKLWSDHR